MSETSPTLYDRFLERRRYLASRRRSAMPAPPLVYSPRLCDEHVEALRVLKRIDGRPMTKLVQEAVERYLAPHGGVDGLIARGRSELADSGEEARQDRGAR